MQGFHYLTHVVTQFRPGGVFLAGLVQQDVEPLLLFVLLGQEPRKASHDYADERVYEAGHLHQSASAMVRVPAAT